MVPCPYCQEPLAAELRPLPYATLAACRYCLNPAVVTAEGGAVTAKVREGAQDVRLVAQKGSIGATILAGLNTAVDNLPVLPEVVHRVMQALDAPESSARDIAQIISEDQVIAMKILQVANSALYGGLSEITDLSAACARLGTRTVANTVQAIANGALYKAKDPRLQTKMRDCWRHALAAAHSAYEIALITAEPRPESLFVAGLTHDVGKLLILNIAGGKGPGLKTVLQTPPILDEVIEAYHPLVGLHIIQRWGLPPEFGIAAYCHGAPNSVPDPEWLGLAHIVALASELATQAGFGTEQPEEISLLSHESSKFLGLNDIKLATLRVDIEDKLAPLLEVSSA